MSTVRDYINELNTVGQRLRKDVIYEYVQIGPNNDASWTAKVYVGEELYGEGNPAKTKRHAQASAAKAAIESFQ